MSEVTPVARRRGPRPAVPEPARHAGRGRWLSLAVAPALACALCAYQITGRSLGFDEGATVAIASQHGSALWSAIGHDGGNMSGWYLLIHALIGAFGDGLLVLRLPSTLATVATVAAIGVIADRLFGRRVALAAGVLCAVSLPLVYWAQTARGYAGMVAFVCAAYLAFTTLSDPPDGRSPGRRPWIAYVLCMTLAMYCSFVAVLIVPAQLLVLVRRRAALRRASSALATVAVLCLPLIVLAAGRGSGQLFWVPRPTRMVETQVLQSLTSAGLAPSFHHIGTTYAAMWGTVGAVLAVLLLVIWRARRGDDMWAMALVLSWCALPASLTFLYSFVGQPLFVPRNLLMSTPAVALVLATAAGFDGSGPGPGRGPGPARGSGPTPARGAGAGRRRLAAAAGSAVLAVLLVVRALPVAAAYGVSPEPWGAVTAHVLARAQPDDCIAFYPQDGQMAFGYYVARSAAADRAPRAVLPLAAWGASRPYVESYRTLSQPQIARRTAGCRRLWFITSHEGQADGPPQARANRARWHALDAALEQRLGSAPVAKYGYASTIYVQLLPGHGGGRGHGGGGGHGRASAQP